jgi:hypothetical protein
VVKKGFFTPECDRAIRKVKTTMVVKKGVFLLNVTELRGELQLGAEDTHPDASGTSRPSSFSFKSSKSILTKGGGKKMTIPAMFRSTDTQKKLTHFSGDGAILTPTKRKLISNCNTRTLLEVFEHDVGKPPTIKGWVGENESPAKKRRCEKTKGSTNMTKQGD